jgi:hypothetical protein
VTAEGVNLRFHGEIFFKIRASGTPFVGLFSLRHVPQGVHHVPYLQLECKLTLVVFGKDFLKNSALGGGGDLLRWLLVGDDDVRAGASQWDGDGGSCTPGRWAVQGKRLGELARLS